MMIPTTHRIGLALALAAFTACSDSSAPTPAFPGTIFCPTGGNGTYATLNDAVAAAPNGGQIVVCDGTWDLDDQLISKPLTIRSQHAGGATIRDADTTRRAQSGRPAIRVSGITTGTVRFVDLTFRIGGRGVMPSADIPGTTRDTTGTFDKVVFDSTHWISRSPSSAIGVMVLESTVPTAKVTFTRSDATDMYIGIWVVAAVETETSFSTFTRSTTAGPDYSGANVTIGGSFGTISDNTFHQCGNVGCIRMPTGGAVTIERNTMDGTPGVASLGGIVLVRSAPAGSAVGVVTIRDNTITGASIAGATGASGWTFISGINLQDPTNTVHVISGNHINNVGYGITASADANVHDNFFTTGTYGVDQASLHTVQFNHNDVVGFTTSFTGPGGPGNYTCNWWGQASGPILPPGNVSTSLYTPFATAKVAGVTPAPC